MNFRDFTEELVLEIIFGIAGIIEAIFDILGYMAVAAILVWTIVLTCLVLGA